MKVTFAGVGEAFDETLANTTLLIESEGCSLLMDCGFTAASAFWTAAENPLEVDALYITHFHGDHYFGIPALMVRSVEEGRTKPLTVLGQAGIEDRFRRLMEMAYTNVLANAKFDLHFIECSPGDDVAFGDMRLSFAMNDHPMPCLSIRADAGGKSVFYSGDGRPTPGTRALAKGCDLVVHESFNLEPDTPGHGTIASSIAFGREAGAGTLALVHVRRNVRRDRKDEILEICQQAEDMDVFLAEPGERREL